MNFDKRKNKSGRKSKFTFTAWHYLIVVGFVISAYLFLQGQYGLINYFQLKKQKAKLVEQIKQLEQEEVRLRKEIRQLINDYSYIEKIVREKYKMGKKKEKIYLIISDDKKGER